MKKWLCFIIIMLLTPCAVLAAPCYGTNLPEKKHLVLGAQTYFINNRDLTGDYGETRSTQHFLLISYGVTDWFSVDLKGGAGYIKHHPQNADEIDYPSYMGGGYGFRLKFYDKEKTKAVFGFQHISVHPYTVEVNNVKNKAVLDDWQLSLLVSHDIAGMTPYIGTRWARMDYIHWVDDVRKLKKSDLTKSVGMIAGVDIPFGEKWFLNMEGSFIDAGAVAVSIHYKF